jgi:hypothetical protein
MQPSSRSYQAETRSWDLRVLPAVEKPASNATGAEDRRVCSRNEIGSKAA